MEELAFRIHGDRVNPQAIQLVVLSQIPLVAEVARFYSDAWAEHVAAAGAQPFEMLPPDFQTLDRLSAAEYRTLLRLPFDYLSPQDV